MATTRRILVIFLLIQAQLATAQFNWGAKVGVNLTNGFQSSYYTYPYAIGINAGFYATYDISKKFFLLGELQYSQKGYPLEFAQIADTYGTDLLRLNYLAVPILAGLKVGKRWEFVLGPEAGFLINAVEHPRNADKMDFTEYFHRFDIGAAAGVRYKFSSRWGAEFRYVVGLTKIFIPTQNNLIYVTTSDSNSTTIALHNLGSYPNSPHNQAFQLDVFFQISKPKRQDR